MNSKIVKVMATYQRKAKERKNNLFKQYNKLKFDIYELTDAITGAIYIDDEDTILLKEKERNHPIFKIFDIDCIEKYRKYTCNFNNKVILRGPDNYYYGFAYLTDLDVKREEIIECLKRNENFMRKVKNDLSSTKMSYENILDVKLVLGILDILRNSAITNLFFCLMKENCINDIYIYEIGNNKIANELYEVLKQIEIKLVDIILNQKNNLNYNINEIIEESIILQHKLINEIKNKKENYENDLYIRYRKSREADNFIENIISIKSCIDTIQNKNDLSVSENLYVFGINYGSVELAIITDVLLEMNSIQHKTGNIMVKFRKAFIESANRQPILKNSNIVRNAYYILIDENIMTGNTLKSTINYLKEYNMKLLDTIIIKHPTVSRLKNIIGKVDEDDFVDTLNNIKGAFIPTNYSKMCEYREGFIFPYMDKLGTFDLYKYEILKNLYRNGNYIEESAVARIGEYYKEVFI